MRSLAGRIEAWLFNSPELAIQHRLFRGLSLISGLLTLLVVVPVNVVQKLPWLANASAFAFGMIALAICWAAGRGRYLVRSLFFAFVALLDVLWFTNAGSFGPTALYFFSGAMYLVVFFEGRDRWGLLSLLLINGVGLIILESVHPQWVLPYPDPGTRYFDLLVGWVIGCLICVLVLWVVLTNYNRERENLERVMESVRENEQRYIQTFQCLPSGLGIADQETGRFITANDGFSDLFGYEVPEVLGRSAFELGIWADPAQREDVISRLHDGGRIRNLPLQVRRKDGSLRWVLYSGESIVLGGRPCLLSSAVDITDQRSAEEALRKSEAMFSAFMEHSPLFVFFKDAEIRAIRLSRNFEGMLGMPVERALGKTMDELFPSELSRTMMADDRRVLEKGEVVKVQERLGDRYYETTKFPISSEGVPTMLAGMTLDITDRVRGDEERRSMEAQLQHLQKLESVGRLAGGVAHDINNVLAAILAVSSVLEGRHQDDALTQEELSKIQQAALRGRDLVKGLTDFARRDLQELEPLDLNVLVRTEARLLSAATLKKVDIRLDLQEPLPPVLGEKSALGNVLMNLCMNAVDAMPGGGRLVLRTRTPSPGAVELAVEDDGHGMAPEVRDRAIEPFFTTKPVGMGTGLGLSVVFGTIKAHGGRLAIQSEPGKGTTILVTLPSSSGAPATAPAAAPKPSEPQPCLRILLVDDDPLIQITAPQMLEAAGHQVSVAKGGAEALAQIETGPDLDLVVLDMNMPGMTGEEVFRRLRVLRPELPVIIATGFVDADTERLLAAGPRVSLLPKPYTRKELVSALAGFTRKQ